MTMQETDVNKLINDRPLGSFQKIIIALGFIVIAIDGFDITLMGFIIPELKTEWGIQIQQLGWIVSAALIGLALGALFSGPLADKWGRKGIIINSVFFFGIWTVIAAFSHNIEQIILFRFLAGLGMGAAMPNVGTLVAEFAPEKNRSFLITVVFCGFTFGAALAGASASWLIPRYGWHSLLLLGGVLPLICVPLLLLKMPESVRFLVTKRASTERIAKIVERLFPGEISSETTFTFPLMNKKSQTSIDIVLSEQYRLGSAMLWIGYFMGLFLVYLLGSWLPTLVKDIGLTVAQAAIVTAMYQAGGTAGSLFAGWTMDRINPHFSLGLLYFTGGILTILIGFSGHSITLLYIVALCTGFCLNGANTGMNALSANYYPTEARATGSGWMHGIGRIGAILSAIIGAHMISLGLDFQYMFSIIAIPALITSLTIFAKGRWGYNRLLFK